MSEPIDQGLESLESELADTTATVTDSDNSQSSAGAPPDITHIGSSFDDESEAYCSDPPDLNPEDADLDSFDRLQKTVSVTDTLEITDSNGPPDLTNSEDFEYGRDEQVLGLEESDFPDVIEAEGCNPDTGESVDIESGAFLSTNSPPDSSPFISESGTDISLAQEVSKSFQLSRFSESRFSESLLAVAPDDILPVRPGDILPVQGTNPLSSVPIHQVPSKRGPGRPRKDGIEGQPSSKKRTKIKSSIKVTHSGMAQHQVFSHVEYPDSNSQCSSSLGEITSDIPIDAVFGISEEESSSMYQLEEGGADIPLRVCSLCNLAERSLLGQGDICRYEPTPNFNPFKETLSKLEKKFSPDPDEKEIDKGSKPLTWRRNRGPMKGTKESKSPRRYPHNWDDDDCFYGNELTFVGFTEDVDISQLFEPSGHVWAHHCCAAWSEGVVQSCNLLLLYVDKAIFSGISQKCNYCHRLGATIKCRIHHCENVYHYPCAAARGCFQDIKTLILLCHDHFDQAHDIAGTEALCVICDTDGNIAEQLFCTSCGNHYHSNCLNPVVSLTPEVRAGWQCPDCKVCQKCRKAGDDNKMLVCDTCDKGYHTYCLKPVMTTIPKNGWKCKNCRVCTDCESRTPGSGPSSRWHHNYSVCDSCYQQRNKGLFCPVCRKAYRQFTSNAMLQCSSCKKNVHRRCDETIELYMDPALRDQQPEYVCITCKKGPEMDIDMAPYPFPLAEESNEEFLKVSGDEFMMKDSEYDMSSMGDNSSQLDSNFLLNEDSVSSMDIDINILEKGAQQLGQPHPEHSTGGKGGKLSVMSRKKLVVGKTRGRPPVAEKKKRTSSFSERKRGAKPKLKSSLSGPSTLGTGIPQVETKSKDDEDDDDHPQTLIMADAEDQFVLNQDVCKSCGSFGKGEEGKLIVCTQCGQCYHPYCVGVKVTKVVLQKGWRCLDCTVCEGCGKPSDEGRLLLCDECDISYHIYCLEPALDHVPKGTWKCKWCVKCVFCGTTSPGFGCQWQNNYTQCGPCSSKICCPICRRSYCEEELIIQCLACDRWLHAMCDGLRNEDETERAADFGYNCKFCRPRTGHPGPLPPPPPPSPPTPEEVRSPTPPLLPLFPPREPEIPKRFLMDGVYLNQTGVNLIQTLMAQVPKIKRIRKKKLEQEMALKAQMEAQGQFKAPSIARMLSTQSSVDGDEEIDDLRMSVDGESTLAFTEGDDTLLSPTGLPNAPLLPGEQPGEEKKKRRRNVVGLGVGGFIAKQRHRGPNKSKLLEAGTAEGEEGEEGAEKPDPEQKQRRKRQARKKSQLENSFPSYLQEAFFGKEILDKSKLDAKQGLKIDPMSEEEQEVPLSPSMLPGIGEPTQALLQDIDQTLKQNQMLPPVSVPKEKTANNADNISSIDDGDFKDILPDDLSELPPDEDLFSIIGPELTKDDESFEDGSDQTKSELPGNLEGMLSPNNLDVEKMLTEGLAHMDGQTVEDIFKGVLQDGQEAPAKPPAEGFPEGVPGAPAAQGNFPGHIPQFAMGPGGFPPGFVCKPGKPGHPGFQDPRFHSSEFPGEQSTWTAGGEGGEDDESDSGNSRRKILKWECDEELGPNATISAILYCNMNHPELRSQHPEWNDRVKRIAKLWRSLSSDEKQPYLLQARKNRQNTKVTKVSNDLKKQKQKEKAAAAAAAAAMRPPMPPGPPPFPPAAEGSPLHSPIGRAPSNPQINEGSSPGNQIPPPGGVPGSPIHRGYPPGQQPPDPLQRLQHVGPQDPYAQPPATPRQMNAGPGMDPYAQPPPTPRSGEHFGAAGNRPQSIVAGGMGQRDPFSATATDPFEQSPTGQRSGGPPGTPQQSPSQPHWPGAAQESDPYAQSPVKRPEGLQSPSGQPPKIGEGFPQPMIRPPGMTRPPFMRQGSQGDPYAKMPATPASSQPEDPYAFQPSTPRPVSEGYRPQGPRMPMAPGQMIRPPGTSVPQSPSGEMRPPFMRQMSASGMQQMPHEVYMQRPQFRPPVSQHMVRPGFDPYSQPPGTPHPGMDPSREPSVLQQMFAAASRRPTIFPFSGMFSSFMHQNYVVPDKGATGDKKQQLREILAQKSKIRQQKEKGGWPEGSEGPGPYPGDERFPVPQVPGMPPQGMERWPAPHMMGPPPHMHPMRPEMQVRMRGPFPEGIRPVMPMRQPRPGGPMPGQPEGFPGPRPMPGQAGHQPGQPPTQEQLAMYPQMPQSQPQMPHGQMPPGYGPHGVPLHQGQRSRMPFDPNKPPPVPVSGSSLPGPPEGQEKVMEAGVEQAVVGAKAEKVKVPGEEKPLGEEHDSIDDFLDLDGSFDILKYADPELDINMEGKTIFDDLEDEPVQDPEVKNESGEKAKEKSDESKSESATAGSKPEGDYQTKFLEFSQKKNDQASNDDEKSKQEINQIAALLQKSEQLGQKLERRDSQKSDGSGKDHTGPNTPSGVLDPIGNMGAQGMSVGSRFQSGLHSPMHQSFQGTAVPSPGSAAGSFPQGPGTPGLVSPKVMPSPRSSAPSPKTPNALSPFSQQPLTPAVSGQQQQSPFSQPTNSPFSPSVACTQSPFSGTVTTSAPVSPFAGAGSQPPFGLPQGSLQATYGSQSSPMAASQSPGQRSPRGPLTPTNQFSSYGKPGQQGPPPAGMMYGQRPPFSGPPGSEAYPSEVDPNLVQAGVRMTGTSVPSSVPYQPGVDGMARFPGQPPPMRGPHGFTGQPSMPFPPGIRMRQPAPGMTSPGVTTPTSQPSTTRPQLLQDQPLLIQDLLEKEKQEQQRQAQQQAMMHRREGEGIMTPQQMPQYRPRMIDQSGMQRHPVDPNWIPPRMYSQPPDGQAPFHVRIPGQQMVQGPRLPTPPYPGPGMGPQGIPPPPQPPIPPMQGEVSPEIERQHVQYEDWLMKHSQYLEMQIKALETQIAKCKRTKKAINARNRQAKKIGKELPPNDLMELDRTTQEQTVLQKQLEGMRKQLRHHQMVSQDYRTKRRERFGDPQSGVLPADGQVPPHPQPRIPGAGTSRMPQAARQEYDAYMINKIRQQQQQQQIQGPRPPIQIVGYDPEKSPKKSPKVPKAIIQDNNPFSEGYQEREKMEKAHIDPVIPSVVTTEPADPPAPMYGNFEQGIRLPASTGDQQRYHLQGPRFGDPSMIGGEPRPAMPGFPGTDQSRMAFRPGAPPFTQGYRHPPSTNTPDLGMPSETEKKPKKRKKKKKAESSTQNQAPLEPRPPIHFTPQSETDKRIMEILESTAGQFRRQQENKGDPEKESNSKPGTPGKSVPQKEAKTDTVTTTAATATTATTEIPVSTVTGSTNSEQQPVQTENKTTHVSTNLNLPSNAELSRESEDSQDSEPILPMNVMIHQQSMPSRVSMPQVFGAGAQQQPLSGKTDGQQPMEAQPPEEAVRSTSSSPRVPPGSSSPRIPTPHSVEAARSSSGSPRIPHAQDGARSTSSSPRIPQSPGQWHQSEQYRQNIGQRPPQQGDGYKSGSSSPRISESPSQRSTASPRVANAPSPKDIQRSISSPRGVPPVDPQRPGSANSESSRTGSPRVPPSHSPAGTQPFVPDPQGLPPGQQAHYMARAAQHQMPPRGKSPGRISPRQSQPSPISESQMVVQGQMPPGAQFQGRKSPGHGMPPQGLGRGMPHYPPASLPAGYQGMGMPPRPGMMQHGPPSRFQQPPGYPHQRPNQFGQEQPRPNQFGPDQQRPMSQRYMYPYPQSVTSSLAESTLAQLPRFTARVTAPESGTVPTSQFSTAGNIMSQAPRPTGPISQHSDAAFSAAKPVSTSITQSVPVTTVAGQATQAMTHVMPRHTPPHSMQNVPHSMQNMPQSMQNIPHSMQNLPHSVPNLTHSMQSTQISQPQPVMTSSSTTQQLSVASSSQLLTPISHLPTSGSESYITSTPSSTPTSSQTGDSSEQNKSSQSSNVNLSGQSDVSVPVTSAESTSQPSQVSTSAAMEATNQTPVSEAEKAGSEITDTSSS